MKWLALINQITLHHALAIWIIEKLAEAKMQRIGPIVVVEPAKLLHFPISDILEHHHWHRGLVSILYWICIYGIEIAFSLEDIS